jgi:hypothetical protein
VRGLRDDERDIFVACNVPKVGLHDGSGRMFTPEETQIALALEKRGLLSSFECDQGHVHCFATDVGRLAYELDTIARSTPCPV